MSDVYDNNSDTYWCWNEIAFDPAVLEIMTGSCDIVTYHDRMSTVEKSKVLDFIRQSIMPKSKVYTERQRQCIYLYFFRSVNEVAISTLLGIHQTVVSQHLRYGKKRLLKALLRSGLLPQRVR